ncbi:MAG: hypothetical protein Kow0083_01230 [Methylophaga sp.]|jgi:hypothetical protein
MRYFFFVIALISLGGCYEDTDVTLHEPGVYKGSPDEHAITYEERAEILAKRFQQVQTDR